MKKMIIAMMLMTICTGCGQRTNDTNNDNANTPNDNIADSTGDYTDQNGDWYNRFETGLKDKNINYSAKSSIDATTIGGVEGYRYTTENGNIDVYRFENGEEFDRIVKEKNIDINGKNSQVEVNDHMIIVTEGLSNDVLDIFKGLK